MTDTGEDSREDTSSNSATFSEDSTSASKDDESSDDEAIITGSPEYEEQILKAREELADIEREDIPTDFENNYGTGDSEESSDSDMEDDAVYSDSDDDSTAY